MFCLRALHCAVRTAHVDTAEAREELLCVAARDREADALVGVAPDDHMTVAFWL
jgi:hypothetical protein